MGAAEPHRLAPSDAVKVTNPRGSGRYVFVCDHASNFIPEEYGTLGLPAAELTRHIAWDPGALPVARTLAEALDAPLVESCVSRLVIDCNRPFDAPDLITVMSETTEIPGNRGLSADERARRIALAHRPFHDAIDSVVAERLATGRTTSVVSVHSFTPIYRQVPRPWHIGILHDDDVRLAEPMIAALRLTGAVVGVNEPYSPADRVYYTLERHARSRGLPCAMIEIRNDEIASAAGQKKWAELLAGILRDLQSGSASNGLRLASN